MLRSGLCGCRNWSVTENEEYRENKVMAKLFFYSGRWTQQYAGHNCMTRHVMCRDTFLRVSKMRSEGHERWYLAKWRARVRLELILNKYCLRIRTSSFYSRYGSVAGFFENIIPCGGVLGIGIILRLQQWTFIYIYPHSFKTQPYFITTPIQHQYTSIFNCNVKLMGSHWGLFNLA
jgi:hypothetical protein